MRHIIIFCICLAALVLFALDPLPGAAQFEDNLPPVITIDNAPSLVPEFRFMLDSESLAWVDGEPATEDGTATPSPSSRSTPPVIQVSQDGVHAAIITNQPDALWLVDLRAHIWRPFLLPTPPARYSDGRYPFDIDISPDFSWLAIYGQWEQNGQRIIRFWRMDDLIALGGGGITGVPPSQCQAHIAVNSTTLRSEPDVTNGAVLGYPLRDETFTVRATTLDRRWVQVTTNGQRAWLGRDFVNLDDACATAPVLLRLGTETASAPVPYGLYDEAFTPNSRYYIVKGNTTYGYTRGFEFIDPARGSVVYTDRAQTLSGASFLNTDPAQYVLVGPDVLDLNTLETVATLPITSSYWTPPSSVAFSPDNTRLFAGWGALGKLYDLQTGAVLKQVALVSGSYGVNWSPDGRYLLFVDTLDSQWRLTFTPFLWDTHNPADEIALTTSDAVTVLPDVDSYALAQVVLGFTPDSRQIILDGAPRVWDIAAGRLLEDLKLPGRFQQYTPHVLLLPQRNGLLRAIPGDTEIVALDGSVRATLPTSIEKWTLASGGRWLVIHESSFVISIWAAVGRENAPTLPPTYTATPTFTHEPTFDFTRAATLMIPMTVTPTMTSTPTPSATPPVPPTLINAPITSLVPVLPTLPPLQPSSATDTLTADNADDIQLLNVVEHPLTLQGKRNYRVVALGFNADGSAYATAGDDTLVVWSTETGESLRRYVLAPDALLVAVAVSSDFTRAAILTQNGDFALVSLASDSTFTDIYRETVGASSSYWNSLVFSPNGSRIALVQRTTPEDTQHTIVTVRDTSSGTIRYSVPYRNERITFTSTNWLARAGMTSVEIYDETAKEIFTYPQPRDYQSNRTEPPFIVSPSLRYVVQVVSEVNLALTSIDGSAPARLLQGHLCSISTYAPAVAFSDDGALLISVDTCDETHFWDVESGQRLTPTEAAAYIPNGMSVGSRWLFVTTGGEIVRWRSAIFDDINQTYGGGNSLVQSSPDARTLAVVSGSRVLFFGIPSETRSAFHSAIGRILPESVNVRAAPSLNADIINLAPAGLVALAGRAASGSFVYLPAYGGWANAGTLYLQVLGAAVIELPVRQ